MLADLQAQIRDLIVGPDTPYRLLADFNPFQVQVRADQSGDRPWGHGGWSGAEWSEVRIVPLLLQPRGTDAGSWLTLQQKLAAAFRPVGDTAEDVECRFALGGREYVMFGRPRLVEAESRLIGTGEAFVRAAFVALDPLIYDAAGFAETIGLPAFVGGLTVGSARSRLWLSGTAGTRVATPDSVALSVTGDIDLRWFGRLDSLGSAGTLISQRGAAGNRAWRVRQQGNDTLALTLSDDGSTETHATIPIPFGTGADVGLRVTWRQSDGRVQWFTADDPADLDGTSWSQTGADDTIAIASIFNSTAEVAVGSSDGGDEWTGSVLAAQVRDGIDGTIVAFPRFDRQTFGTSVFADRHGNTWTLFGDARFSGGRGSALATPFRFPSTPTDGQVDVTNSGTADVGLTLRIDGPVAQPSVTVQRPDGTVQTWRYLDKVPSGRFLQVDTAARTALVDGLPQANRRGRVAGDWPLLPGNPDGSGATSTVLFRASNNDDAGTLKVTGMSGWW